MNPSDLSMLSGSGDMPASLTSSPNAEMERLLAAVGGGPQSAPIAQPEHHDEGQEGTHSHDFRNPTLLSPRDLRKLRQHQEGFVNALAARLSLFLRVEFGLKLTRLQTLSYQGFSESWANPTHLALFKTEPLRGVSVLEIQPRLGLSIVDRLMGGPGQVSDEAHEISEIEKALLEQVVQLILGEWCSHWLRIKELKPIVLGSENNGRFVQVASRETNLLVIAMEAKIGNCSGVIQIGFPFPTVEVLIRQLCFDPEAAPAAAPASSTASQTVPAKWNSCFNDVRVPLTAEWNGLEMTAREVLNLKIGDVLQLDPQIARQVQLRLGEVTRFNGRLGTVAGDWAAELTEVINP